MLRVGPLDYLIKLRLGLYEPGIYHKSPGTLEVKPCNSSSNNIFSHGITAIDQHHSILGWPTPSTHAALGRSISIISLRRRINLLASSNILD